MTTVFLREFVQRSLDLIMVLALQLPVFLAPVEHPAIMVAVSVIPVAPVHTATPVGLPIAFQVLIEPLADFFHVFQRVVS